ncbi:MAG: rhodanese-like domain-containing protein [Bacilli bacterium]|nr:rhodanese-like domain-containing protein [Bacilli bacterium]
MKKIISLLVCILMLTACGNDYKTIDSNEAMDLINNEAIVIDVRSNDEYDTGHIEGSINIPVDNINSVNYNKDTTIIVYCATGMRSSNAAETLISLGYTNVYNLDGGLINWGFELED